MKKNRLILIIAIILLIIALFLVFSNRNSTLEKEETDFALNDTANVTKIFLVDKKNKSVLLEKISPGNWRLNNKYKGHTLQIDGLLKVMMDLRVKAPVPKVARNNVMARLSATAIKVEIYSVEPRIDLFGLELFPREVRSKVYYVGGPTQNSLGTFMLLEGYENPYIIYIPSFRGFVAANYSANEDDWRDHTVFKTGLNDIQSVSVEFFDIPEESYVVNHTGIDNYELITSNDHSSKPFDTLRILNFLTSFSDIRFEAVLNSFYEQDYIDSVAASIPTHRITLITTTGDTNRITTFRKEGFGELYDEEEGIHLVPYDLDRMFAFKNDENDLILLQYFVFDKVLRTASYLRGLESDNPYPLFEN